MMKTAIEIVLWMTAATLIVLLMSAGEPASQTLPVREADPDPIVSVEAEVAREAPVNPSFAARLFPSPPPPAPVAVTPEPEPEPEAPPQEEPVIEEPKPEPEPEPDPEPEPAPWLVFVGEIYRGGAVHFFVKDTRANRIIDVSEEATESETTLIEYDDSRLIVEIEGSRYEIRRTP